MYHLLTTAKSYVVEKLIWSELFSELELVQSAAFTDPSDQSAWFYQRWLLGRNEPLPRLAQAVVTPEKIYLAFSAPLTSQDISVVGISATNWILLNQKYPSNTLV
jgi:geranylgeranyl transferase type-2 subunit alpha